MNEQQVTQLILKITQQSNNSSRSSATSSITPIAPPVLTYTGLVGVGNAVSYVQVLATGAFAGGETSATLTTNWIYPSGIYTTYFSNGDVKSATFTNGSTAVTWSGGLSGAATADIAVDGVLQITVNFLPVGWSVSFDLIGGLYTVTHNLGTSFYAMTATASQSTNIFAVPVTEAFDNSVDIAWGDIASGQKTPTGFYFTLTVINNRKVTTPSYYGTFVN